MLPDILTKLSLNSPLGKKLQILQSQGIKICDWHNGYVRCPGDHLHTTPTAIKDTQLFVNAHGAYLKCFHTSCAQEVAKINQWLGSGNSSPINQTVLTGSLNIPQAVHNPHATQALVDAYPWSYSKLQFRSPHKLGRFVSRKTHPGLLLSLFQPHDVVWIGFDVKETGNAQWANKFKTAQGWKNWPSLQGRFICPSTFYPGTFSRGNANVKDRRFLVIESDILSKDETCSIFKWMMAQGHRLRAVVDTGNKSLHGWFDYPAPGLIPQLKKDLITYGCDPAMFTPSQAVRLPGVQRNRHKFQELIYLDL